MKEWTFHQTTKVTCAYKCGSRKLGNSTLDDPNCGSICKATDTPHTHLSPSTARAPPLHSFICSHAPRGRPTQMQYPSAKRLVPVCPMYKEADSCGRTHPDPLQRSLLEITALGSPPQGACQLMCLIVHRRENKLRLVSLPSSPPLFSILYLGIRLTFQPSKENRLQF